MSVLMSVLLLIDLSFLGANALKIPQGGWFPLVIGAGCFLLLTTWKRGRQIFSRSMAEDGMSMDLLLPSLSSEHGPLRVDGTAVFMSGTPDKVPHALLHNLKHNKVLHKRVILMTLTTVDVPYVAPEERLTVAGLGHGFYRVGAIYGFQEKAEVEDVLQLCSQQHKMMFNMMETTFFLARATVIPSMRIPGMAAWRESLFAWMFKNASPITNYFDIPPNRVVELGTRVEI
jgi:KUP system potassium uptake protein